MLCGLALFAHRYDLRRRLELERVRLRIATDLHDDLGASLTRMTILTEVVIR
jgi:signal transduction histidine kinase